MNTPPAGAELFDYEGLALSRSGGEAFVWTPDSRPASPRTVWMAVTQGRPIDSAEFDALRHSFAG
jgi:hypothetical protein